MLTDIVKIFIPSLLSFGLGIFITYPVSDFLVRHKFWKKKSVIVTTDGVAAPITNSLHSDENRKTPRMGGIVIWLSTLITVFVFWIPGQIAGPVFGKLNFLSRNQTWLTVFTLIVGALIGLVDDYWSVTERYRGVRSCTCWGMVVLFKT
jgi:UDP-N-acetylmuramyl pentapeptide phosphotransferase/UDP-N-acetylglucosamine-1-phosphate transferase